MKCLSVTAWCETQGHVICQRRCFSWRGWNSRCCKSLSWLLSSSFSLARLATSTVSVRLDSSSWGGVRTWVSLTQASKSTGNPSKTRLHKCISGFIWDQTTISLKYNEYNYVFNPDVDFSLRASRDPDINILKCLWEIQLCSNSASWCGEWWEQRQNAIYYGFSVISEPDLNSSY